MSHPDENASSVPQKPTTPIGKPQKNRTTWPIPKAHVLIALAIFIIISLLLLINHAIEKTPNLASFANMPAQYATTAPSNTTDDKAVSSAAIATDDDDAQHNNLPVEPPTTTASAVTSQDTALPSTVTTAASATDTSSNVTASRATAMASRAPAPIAAPSASTTLVQASAAQPAKRAVLAVSTDHADKATKTVKPPVSPASRAPSVTERSLSYRTAPGHYFTIQLSGSYQENNVRHFAEQNHLQGYLVYQTQHNGKPWFVLVNGIYPNLAAARTALANLAKPLQKQKPWPKTLKQVQQELKK